LIRSVSAEELDQVLAEEPRLVLLAFLTEGCEPCRQLRPQLEQLAAEHGDACAVVTVNADADPDTVARFAVRSFPSLLFLKQGVELHRIKSGALPASTIALLGRT
jgi:thioredoxin 1